MKKTIRIAAVAVIVPLALAGCSAGAPAEDGPVTLRHSLWQADQLPAYEKCAEDFAKANPDITVDIEQAGWDDYWSRINTNFVSGDQYDTFTSHLAYFPEFAKNGQILALDEYIERDDIDTSIYQDGLLDLWKSAEGEQFGLPKDFDTVALFYNEKLIQEAGVTKEQLSSLTWNPEDGGTYEDVIARLTVDKNGVRGDEPGFDKNNVATYGLWLDGAGGGDGHVQYSYFTGTTGWSSTEGPWTEQYNYDDPRFQEAIDWWYSLVEKGYMPALEAATGLSGADQLIAGTAAINSNGSWMTGYIFDSAGEAFTPALAPTPVGPSGERASMLNGVADNISASTKHPEEAWEWVKYLASPECQNVVGEAGVVFPAIKESTDLASAAFQAKGVDTSAFTVHIDEGTTFLFPITDLQSEVGALIKPAMESVMSGKAPASSLTEVNEKINALFE